MASPVRVVHYLNQFFAGIGGEEAANTPVEVRDGLAGAGRALQQALGTNGTIVATIVGGDNVVAEEPERATAAMREALTRLAPDVLVAGPAFDSGRYGLACAWACIAAQQLGIKAVTAMYPDNPGFTTNRHELICLPTGTNVAEMSKAMAALARMAVSLGSGRPLGSADEEGYLWRGFRRPVLREKSGAARAVDMALARLAGRPFTSEIPVAQYDAVPPTSPVADLATVKLGIVTSGGLVPMGNPDRLVSARAERFFRYPIEDRASLMVGEWESVHGGYSTHAVNTRNPNYVVPLDVLRELEAAGRIGSLHHTYYATVGNQTAVAEAKRMGAEIAQELHQADVGAVLLVAT
ncbi:MAG: glycine/betaine/sarcosine/D-proline family reductase selenoprotein B [Chloroflexi bacterium]|nr:glycine/betaine/sarcosine/D-proline family reductase selenoprotein B [Chloroflexota bacterium]